MKLFQPLAPQRGASDDETLVGIEFPDTFRAQEFLTATNRLAAAKKLALKDAVMVIARGDGRTRTLETTDPQPSKAAFSGAMWAGLFGLLTFGLIGWLAGALVGAGLGALTAKAIDRGITDEWVDWFRNATPAGATTLALLVSDLDRSSLVGEAARFPGARLVYANLDDVTIDRLRQALGQPELVTRNEAW